MTKVKILIAEDELIIYLGLRRAFINAGYEICDIAITGAEAITIAERTKPDIALIDINLTGHIDGIETAKQIKARFDIPIIYMTGYSDQGLKERAEYTKPIGYFVKPIEFHKLKSTIKLFFKRH
jgi:DNA-binding NarL/FixJ family response regulator